MEQGLAHALGSSAAQNTKHYYAGATTSANPKCKKCGKRHKKAHKCKK